MLYASVIDVKRSIPIVKEIIFAKILFFSMYKSLIIGIKKNKNVYTQYTLFNSKRIIPTINYFDYLLVLVFYQAKSCGDAEKL